MQSVEQQNSNVEVKDASREHSASSNEFLSAPQPTPQTTNWKMIIPVSIVTIAMFIASVVSFIIAIIYLIFAIEPSFQQYYQNQAYGFWLLLLVSFTFLQAAMNCLFYFFNTNRYQCWLPMYPVLDFCFYAIMGFFSIIMFFAYAIGHRADAIWALVLLGTVVINVVIIILYLIRFGFARRNHMKQPNPSISAPLSRVEKVVAAFSGIAFFLNHVFKVAALIITFLLLIGALILSGGMVAYPPRGQFATFALDDNSGRTQQFLFHCEGPKNDSFPVILFDGSGSHGMGDYLAIQYLLTNAGRRSCIFDKPGAGYADYLFSDQTSFHSIYHNMIMSMQEKPPYIFVGWGGGAEAAYDYAAKHPENVHSMVFLDGYPTSYEFSALKALNNWTQEQYVSNFEQAMAARLAFTKVINIIGVPFGLMPLFLGAPKTLPAQFRNEQSWYFMTDKTWISQQLLLSGMKANYFDTYNQTVDSNIKIHTLLSIRSDQQVIDMVCRPRGMDPNSSGCLFELASNRYAIEQRLKLGEKNRGEIVPCTDSACNLGYFVYDGTQWTVDALSRIYANTSI